MISRFSISLMALLLTLPIHGGYKMGDRKPIPAKSKSTQRPKTRQTQPMHRTFTAAADENTALTSLSQRFTIEIEKLKYYRRLKHGYEEIVPALLVAEEAQIEVGKVLKFRTEGKSWSEIASEHSIELKPLNVEVNRLLEPLRKTLPKKILNERPSLHR